MSQRIFLPDTLANWQWPRHLNPHYAEVKKASAAWAKSFRAFQTKAQEAFDRCDFNLLASFAYPLADEARLRSGCDLMNLFFVIDEYSDVSTEEEVRAQKDIVMDAIRNTEKPRPAGEWIGGEVSRQFWDLAKKTASTQAQKRFIDTFDEYLESVVQQAADRNNSHVRGIESYLEVRRNTIGAKPSFALLEFDMQLPDESHQSSGYQRNLRKSCIDMLCLGNDVVSYNLEQARDDDGHNIVTIAMNELRTDVAGAMIWVDEYHKQLESRFMENFKKVPRWGGPIDLQVARYCDGLGNWVRANDQWSFESERYFGKKGPEIIQRRWITLMPKMVSEELGPQIVDGFHL
uniref:Terpene synthase n=1 Tax=Armillaria gallica TaxID=47427 RepID=A0A7U3MPB9_ARMGA|nr:Pro1 [Armillaria gallica]